MKASVLISRIFVLVIFLFISTSSFALVPIHEEEDPIVITRLNVDEEDPIVITRLNVDEEDPIIITRLL